MEDHDLDSDCDYCIYAGPTTYHYGDNLCPSCLDIECNTDWDAYEEAKRQRIFEEQEY